MDEKRWILEKEQEWTRLEQLLERSGVSIQQLPPEEIRELGFMYRSAINDLSRARSSETYQHLVPYLNNLVKRVHARVYEKPPSKWTDIFEYFAVRFPQTVRRNTVPILIAFATFAFGAALAMLTVYLDPSTSSYFLPQPVIDQVARGTLWMENIDAAPSSSSFLMTNNIKVAFYAYVLGISFGVGTLAVLFQNGLFAFGGPLQICFSYGMGDELLLFMMPHGVIELTTIFIAGGAGLIVGHAMLFPNDRPRWENVREKSRESLVLISGCAVLLVIAGIIEGMLSLNRAVPDIVRAVVASGSAILLFGYLRYSGRARITPPDSLAQ